jgi:hypothetical protein
LFTCCFNAFTECLSFAAIAVMFRFDWNAVETNTNNTMNINSESLFHAFNLDWIKPSIY